MDMNFYRVDLEYIDFLKNYEIKNRSFTRVPNVNYHSRNNKFFYGAVLTINGIDYFVPVSSNTRVKQDDILIVVKDKRDPNYGPPPICIYAPDTQILPAYSDKR